MRYPSSSILPCTVAIVVLVLHAAVESSPVTAQQPGGCVISELLGPCGGALTTGQPSAGCCAKLNEQVHCYCEYMKDPFYWGIVHSPDGQRAAAACGILIPQCS